MARKLWLLLIPFAAFAQQVEKPMFSTTTHMVVETVTVKDKQGNPITGLTAKDFTLTEDGKPQTIAFVEYQKLPDAPAAPVALTAFVAPVSRLARTQIAAEKPGDVRYHDRRLLALYFDMTAMPPQDQGRALQAAQRFIRTQMTGSDLMAVLSFSGGAVQVLDDFTADRAKLLETLQMLRGCLKSSVKAFQAGSPRCPSRPKLLILHYSSALDSHTVDASRTFSNTLLSGLMLIT